jgi:hypothetical protein
MGSRLWRSASPAGTRAIKVSSMGSVSPLKYSSCS